MGEGEGGEENVVAPAVRTCLIRPYRQQSEQSGFCQFREGSLRDGSETRLHTKLVVRGG
jgi:hypothetical protein